MAHRNITNIIHHNFHGLKFKKTGKAIVEKAANLCAGLEGHLKVREERIRSFITTKLDNLINPDKFITMLQAGSVESVMQLAATYTASNSGKVAASEMDGFELEVTSYNDDRNTIESLQLITRNLAANDTVYELTQTDLSVLEF